MLVPFMPRHDFEELNPNACCDTTTCVSYGKSIDSMIFCSFKYRILVAGFNDKLRASIPFSNCPGDVYKLGKSETNGGSYTRIHVAFQHLLLTPFRACKFTF